MAKCGEIGGVATGTAVASSSILTGAIDVREPDGSTAPMTGLFIHILRTGSYISNPATDVSLEYGAGESFGVGQFVTAWDNSTGSGPAWELWVIPPGFGDGNIDSGIGINLTSAAGNTIVIVHAFTMTSVNTGTIWNVADYIPNSGTNNSVTDFRTFSALTGSKYTIGVDPASSQWVVVGAIKQTASAATVTLTSGTSMMTQVNVGAGTANALSAVMAKIDPATGGTDTVTWSLSGNRDWTAGGFFPMPAVVNTGVIGGVMSPLF